MKRAVVLAGLIMLMLALLVAYATHPLFTDLDPKRQTSEMAVVILSGDMGFRAGLSSATAERIASKGLHVVGVNSLRFAWRERSPKEIADLLREAILRTHARKIVLIGQSYGADLVHVGAALLPDAIRQKIAGIILVVPTTDIYYRIGLREYFGWGVPDAQAIDTARRINWAPLTCIYGREEPDSICPLMHASNVHRLALPGDHYLRHDPDLLFNAVWPAIQMAESQQ